MVRVLRWLDEHLEEYILIFLSALTVVVVFYQVFMRYVMGDSSRWSEELARYAFIWLIYIGISYGVKKQRHITVDAFLMLFKAKGKVILNIAANLLFLAFSLTMIVYGYDVMMYIFDRNQTSAGLHLPMGYVYAAGPIGMALTSIRLIQHIVLQINRLRSGDLEEVEKEFEEHLKQ